jgi:hypothetical protein
VGLNDALSWTEGPHFVLEEVLVVSFFNRPFIGVSSQVEEHMACRRGAELSSWILQTGRRNEIDLWSVLEVGLLRDLPGLHWLEIARRIDVSSTAVTRRYEIHRREIAGRGCYSERLQETAAEVLACLG